MALRTYVIYLLVDPRDGEIRYVGCSTKVRARYTQHLYDMRRKGCEARPKVIWLRELKALGLWPICVPFLMTCDAQEAKKLEEIWIRRLSLAGCSLTMMHKRENLLIAGTVRPDQRRTDGKRMEKIKSKSYVRISRKV